MKRTVWQTPCLILFALFGSACSSMPQGNGGLSNGSNAENNWQSVIENAPRATNASLAPLGKTAIGQVATLASENPLGVTRARVIDEYSAASGRLCRRIAIAERQPRLRVVCREPGDDWALVRGLVAAQR